MCAAENSTPAYGINTVGMKGWGVSSWASSINRVKAGLGWQSSTGQSYDDFNLDKNGYFETLPVDEHGRTGTTTMKTLWYGADTADIPDSIYAGKFYFMAEGQGTIDLIHKGPGGFRMENIKLDGKTVIEFEFNPNDQPLDIVLKSTDPNGTGDYLREFSIVHESHMELYKAGEIFTPEYLELIHELDPELIRYMKWMEGNYLHSNDHTGDYITYNQGLNGSSKNGVPIDVIVEFGNETGTDIYINPSHASSLKQIREMAEHIAENLNDGLKVYVERGNEAWSGKTGSADYLTEQAIKTWGEKVTKNPDGTWKVNSGDGFFVRDLKGFMKDNGYDSMAELRKALGVDHNLYESEDGWVHYHAMRATQTAKIFKDVFKNADRENDVVNVLATETKDPKATDELLKAALWKEANPKDFIEPASVFDFVGVGAYFGSTLGSRDIDLVAYWKAKYGTEGAIEKSAYYEMASLKDGYIALDKKVFKKVNGEFQLDKNWVLNDVNPKDAIIDLSDAIIENNNDIRRAINTRPDSEGGRDFNVEILFGDDVHNYVRLAQENGHTVIKVRPDLDSDFQTVVKFDRIVNKTLEEMIEDGMLIPRGLKVDMWDDVQARFVEQEEVAAKYGLTLMAQEGGDHIKPANHGGFREAIEEMGIGDFYEAIKFAPEMGEMYEKWYELSAQYLSGPFLFFQDYQAGNPFGAVPHLGMPDDSHNAVYNAQLEISNKWNNQDQAPTGVTKEGGRGNDSLRGTGDDDVLKGHKGNDTLSGLKGDDVLRGGSGEDKVYGGDGDDTLFGGGNDDRIKGAGGADTLYGGKGDDTLFGGGGADTFVFNFDDESGRDLIKDFKNGVDVIEIRGGAENVDDLKFRQSGDDVKIKGGNETIVVEDHGIGDFGFDDFNFI